ncbi:hypothetical protein [Undibacterium luofuense]|uniref:Uncharacterized protein n=1 Tax=Undibacterium luofuense TaxID=2828733 RepID=A0A941I721_9BURK|nr:hypothetical protein [Undibacterium luofuense]MBR7783326.1 hypothetical protein [Undibacterium luofuense]
MTKKTPVKATPILAAINDYDSLIESLSRDEKNAILQMRKLNAEALKFILDLLVDISVQPLCIAPRSGKLKLISSSPHRPKPGCPVH